MFPLKFEQHYFSTYFQIHNLRRSKMTSPQAGFPKLKVLWVPASIAPCAPRAASFTFCASTLQRTSAFGANKPRFFSLFETCFGNLLVSRTSIHKWRTLGMLHMLFPTFQKHDSKLVLSRNAKQKTFQYFTSWLLPLILSRFLHPGYKWMHPTYPTSKSRDMDSWDERPSIEIYNEWKM